MKKCRAYALTGGIGSGKSLALKFLSDAGYNTLSSDKIVHELYEKNSVKRVLKKICPTAVSGLINLKLDKAVLGERAFKDRDFHARLTSAVTPLVLKEIKRRLKNKTALSFVEVPLLFECGYEHEFDGTVVIFRDKTARISAVKQRSNLTDEQVLERMNKQIDYDSLDLSGYHVIKNDGDIESLKNAVLSLAKSLE